MTTRLSSLQYPMLKMFADSPGDYMSIEDAQRYDQRPFRSMLMRNWVRYTPRRGFRITREGLDAWSEFRTHDIGRKNPTMPLTSYFDPDAYGIRSHPNRTRSGSAHQGAAA